MHGTDKKKQATDAMKFVLSAIEQFRNWDDKVSVQWIAAFAFVAANEGCLQKELQEALGMSQTTTSMLVLSLSTGRTAHDEGLGVIETYTDLDDRRAKRIRLTPAGKRIVNSITGQWQK